MGARLRKLKTMNRGKKLSDGKSISCKNRLTDKLIDRITTYHGNAIRQNNSSTSDKRQATWAIYCHYRSTDEEPMHHFCPIGSFAMRVKRGNRLVPGPDYMVDALKLSNQAPKVSGESL
ncbi:uncharacterized protein TNCV_1374151 [Trichonephila clavipes]|nr:uncharacterized protein TNCV_1374151 [Trichonephila clavipes]